jgi:hypothetical protein
MKEQQKLVQTAGLDHSYPPNPVPTPSVPEVVEDRELAETIVPKFGAFSSAGPGSSASSGDILGKTDSLSAFLVFRGTVSWLGTLLFRGTVSWLETLVSRGTVSWLEALVFERRV